MKILEVTRRTRAGTSEAVEMIMGEHVLIVQAFGCVSERRFTEAHVMLKDLPCHLRAKMHALIDADEQAYLEKIGKGSKPVLANSTPLPQSPAPAPGPVSEPLLPAVEEQVSLEPIAEEIPNIVAPPKPLPEIVTDITPLPVMPDEPIVAIESEPEPASHDISVVSEEPIVLKKPLTEASKPRPRKNGSTKETGSDVSLSAEEIRGAVLERWKAALPELLAHYEVLSDAGSRFTASRKRLMELLLQAGPSAANRDELIKKLWPDTPGDHVDGISQLAFGLTQGAWGAPPMPGTVVYSSAGYKILPQAFPPAVENEEKIITVARDFLKSLVINQHLVMDTLWRNRGRFCLHAEISMAMFDDPAVSTKTKARSADAVCKLQKNLKEHPLSEFGEIRVKKGTGYGFFLYDGSHDR